MRHVAWRKVKKKRRGMMVTGKTKLWERLHGVTAEEFRPETRN